MYLQTRVQILVEAVCNSHSLGESMNPTILPPAVGKLQGRALTMKWQSVWLKKNPLNSVKKLTLCHILLVAEGLGK